MAASPQAPPPAGVKPWFAIVIFGALLFALGVFIAAVRLRKSYAPTPPPTTMESRTETSWIEQHKAPTSAPTPALAPPPIALPAVNPPAAAPYQQQTRFAPYQQRPESAAAQQRRERYQQAMASSLLVKSSNGQTLETPKLVATNQATTASTAPLMVNTKPAPPHTITAWTFIYGTLETGINSDHPGDVIGRVSQDVKDSVTQTEVLIPQGSTLHGYEGGPAQVRPNDTSIIVRWDDIELPNGGHIPIPKMPGTDPEGYPGFEDLINHHYASRWIPPILISGITASSMLATQPTYGGYQGYDAQQQATEAFTQSLAGHATGELSADINRNKPTFIIENGYHFRVLVTRDMTFDKPWSGR